MSGSQNSLHFHTQHYMEPLILFVKNLSKGLQKCYPYYHQQLCSYNPKQQLYISSQIHHTLELLQSLLSSIDTPKLHSHPIVEQNKVLFEKLQEAELYIQRIKQTTCSECTVKNEQIEQLIGRVNNVEDYVTSQTEELLHQVESLKEKLWKSETSCSELEAKLVMNEQRIKQQQSMMQNLRKDNIKLEMQKRRVKKIPYQHNRTYTEIIPYENEKTKKK